MNHFSHIHISRDDRIEGDTHNPADGRPVQVCLWIADDMLIFFKDDECIFKIINELQNAVKKAQEEI